MDLRPNPSIIPSNAPALQDKVSEVRGRILQERSTNPQHEAFGPGVLQNRKAGYHAQSENSGTNGLPLSASTGVTSQFGEDTESKEAHERVDREAATLWRLAQKVDAYRKYRARQPAKDGQDKDQKWPEHVEAAFFKGLVKYKPRGRRKVQLKGSRKPRGRNELIADAITEWTGEYRKRKQVSSHIQVLKNYFKDHPRIMAYFSTEDLDSRSSRHSRHHLSSAAVLRKRPSRSSKPQLPGTQAFGQAPDSAMPAGACLPPDEAFDFMPPASFSCMLSLSCFEMYVRDSQTTPPAVLHTFTKLPASHQQPVHQISSRSTWESAFPVLASLPSEGAQDFAFILCEASFRLMTRTCASDDELAIRLEVQSLEDLSIYDDIKVHTRFYDQGTFLYQHISSAVYDRDSRRLDVHFGSRFWAAKMMTFSRVLREAKKDAAPTDGDADGAEAVRRARKRVRGSLERLSAIQEVHGIGDTKARRILMIYWKFSQAEDGEEGLARWQHIVLPAAEVQETAAQAMDDRALELALDYPQAVSHAPLPQQLHPFPYELDALSAVALAAEMQPHMQLSLLAHDLSQAHRVDFTAGDPATGTEPPASVAAEEYPDIPLEGVVDSLQHYGSTWPTYDSFLSTTSCQTGPDAAWPAELGQYAALPYQQHPLVHAVPEEGDFQGSGFLEGAGAGRHQADGEWTLTQEVNFQSGDGMIDGPQ